MNGAEALDALYWRAEILQALFWMRSEGLASDVDPASLARFLAADRAAVAHQLELLSAEGYLVAAGGRYALTARGHAEGRRGFADEFAELTHPGHYECGPGCWCQDPDHEGQPCPNQPAAVPEPGPDPLEPAPADRWPEQREPAPAERLPNQPRPPTADHWPIPPAPEPVEDSPRGG